MKKSRQELEKQCAEAETKVEQYQHEGQRYAVGYAQRLRGSGRR